MRRESCIPVAKKSRIKRFGKNRYFVLLSTFPKRKDAERVAAGLIEKRLAACCNLIPGLTSFFRWKGKKERSREFLLLIKTEGDRLEEVRNFLRTHHPYELPELIGLPIAAGDSRFLSWITKESH